MARAERGSPSRGLLTAIRIAMGLAIVVALVLQFVLGRRDFDLDPVHFFSFFTVLSNIAAAVLLLAEGVQPERMSAPSFILVRGAITLYMAVTGLVYAVLLAPASADVSITKPWVDLIVHVIGPTVIVADWFVDPPPSRPTVRAASVWLVFPVVYLVYSLIRGPIADWYPYPFLDPTASGGYLGVAGYSVGVAAVVIAIGAVLRWGAGRRPPLALSVSGERPAP